MTQVPPYKSRTAYITPQTSFNVPSDEAEIDGFGSQMLTHEHVREEMQTTRAPAKWLHELRQMPPTPASIARCNSSEEIANSSCNHLDLQADIELAASSSLVKEALSGSPTYLPKGRIKPEELKFCRRGRHRRVKHASMVSTCPNQPDHVLRNPLHAAPGSNSPEPWPVPFPLADRGIYPYLPPAKQFDQMVRFTSATEDHIDKWNLHSGVYPVSLLRQVLSAQECVHMGLYSQLEHMHKLLGELEEMVKPTPHRERARRGKVGRKNRKATQQILEKIKFMRSITKQHQVCYYESRIPT